jgi:hypothetical protein
MNLRLIGLGTARRSSPPRWAACGALQQDPQCVVAKGHVRHRLHAKSTTTARPLKPEVVGLEKYFTETRHEGHVASASARGRHDAQVDRDAAHGGLDPDAPLAPHSVGEMTEVPGRTTSARCPRSGHRGWCARTPALSLTYAWSNLRVYNTAEIPGTQFTADLTLHRERLHRRVHGEGHLAAGELRAPRAKPDDVKCDRARIPPRAVTGAPASTPSSR